MTSIATIPLTLQYEGLFDFEGMYAAVIDWAKNYGFMWHEQDYKHKVPSPLGAEQEFIWHMTKRIDQYVQYEISMRVHIWEMLDVEVEVAGKKKNLTKARLMIQMKGNCVTDWQKRFDKGGPLGRKLGEWYMKIFKHDISGLYWDTLVYRIYNLHAIMKTYLDMQSKKFAFKGYIGED